MLEFLVCSMVTILPDFLFRHFAQGKRIGVDITLYSVWYELRWGITTCAMLTITLITIVFFYHPSTTNVSSMFRTVTILSETGGRVEEVYVFANEDVVEGQPLFKLDDSDELAHIETLNRKIEEIDAAMVLATSELDAANGLIAQAKAAYDQADNEFKRKQEINLKNSGIVSQQELESLEHLANSRYGSLLAAQANGDVVDAKLNTLQPAQKASAQASLKEAQTKLDHMVIYAGVTGKVTQFQLRPGDVVNPILRPAGILIPADSGHGRFQAGFNQIAAQVLKPGMIAEITCVSKPLSIIPMVITDVQDVISAGQFRPGDQLVDAQDIARPGTVFVRLEALYAGQTDGIPPGSKCIANAYTNSHTLIASGELGTLGNIYYHVVDTLGLVHALILRIQALALPVSVLVLSGH